ncbi:hypothetical protein U1Q18_016732 [Sarracenia purpurea var. burkii]
MGCLLRRGRRKDGGHRVSEGIISVSRETNQWQTLLRRGKHRVSGSSSRLAPSLAQRHGRMWGNEADGCRGIPFPPHMGSQLRSNSANPRVLTAQREAGCPLPRPSQLRPLRSLVAANNQ